MSDPVRDCLRTWSSNITNVNPGAEDKCVTCRDGMAGGAGCCRRRSSQSETDESPQNESVVRTAYAPDSNLLLVIRSGTNATTSGPEPPPQGWDPVWHRTRYAPRVLSVSGLFVGLVASTRWPSSVAYSALRSNASVLMTTQATYRQHRAGQRASNCRLADRGISFQSSATSIPTCQRARKLYSPGISASVVATSPR